MRLNQVLKEGVSYILSINDGQSLIVRSIVEHDSVIAMYTSNCHSDDDFKVLFKVLHAMSSNTLTVTAVDPDSGESFDFTHKVKRESSPEAIGFKLWLSDTKEINVSDVSDKDIAELKEHGSSIKSIVAEYKRIILLKRKGLKLPDNYKQVEADYDEHIAFTAKLKENIG